MILVTNNEGTPGAPVTAAQLAEGRPGLDAIEAGIRLVEADESIRTVGRGGWPNLLGEVELDAAMMHGGTLRSGAVGSLKGYLHPVSVARQVLERLPHEILVGEGAARFAKEIDAEAGENLIEDAAKAWQDWFQAEVPARQNALPGPMCPWRNSAAMPSTRRSAVTPRSSWRKTLTARSSPAPAPRAGAGSTPGASVIRRWWAPASMPTAATARRPAPAPARWRSAPAPAAPSSPTSRWASTWRRRSTEAVADMDALKGGLINRVTIHAIDTQGEPQGGCGERQSQEHLLVLAARHETPRNHVPPRSSPSTLAWAPSTRPTRRRGGLELDQSLG